MRYFDYNLLSNCSEIKNSLIFSLFLSFSVISMCVLIISCTSTDIRVLNGALFLKVFLINKIWFKFFKFLHITLQIETNKKNQKKKQKENSSSNIQK